MEELIGVITAITIIGFGILLVRSVLRYFDEIENPRKEDHESESNLQDARRS